MFVLSTLSALGSDTKSDDNTPLFYENGMTVVELRAHLANKDFKTKVSYIRKIAFSFSENSILGSNGLVVQKQYDLIKVRSLIRDGVIPAVEKFSNSSAMAESLIWLKKVNKELQDDINQSIKIRDEKITDGKDSKARYTALTDAIKNSKKLDDIEPVLNRLHEWSSNVKKYSQFVDGIEQKAIDAVPKIDRILIDWAGEVTKRQEELKKKGDKATKEEKQWIADADNRKIAMYVHWFQNKDLQKFRRDNDSNTARTQTTADPVRVTTNSTAPSALSNQPHVNP